jgi:hypothetical protein
VLKIGGLGLFVIGAMGASLMAILAAVALVFHQRPKKAE